MYKSKILVFKSVKAGEIFVVKLMEEPHSVESYLVTRNLTSCLHNVVTFMTGQVNIYQFTVTTVGER